MGEIYNIGARNEWTNLEITDLILKTLDKPERLITYVEDRKGHDRRYSLDTTKINQMGWVPKYEPAEAMVTTIEWYRQHPEWWQKIKSGEYLDFYQQQYMEKI